MQIRKAIVFLFIFPLLVGLACLQPVAPTETPAASTSTPIIEELRATVPASEVAAVVQAIPTSGRACALVSADEALHLRQDPDPRALILAFMRSGEVVRLISTRNEDWWLIQRKGLIGFARSRYLKSVECAE